MFIFWGLVLPTYYNEIPLYYLVGLSFAHTFPLFKRFVLYYYYAREVFQWYERCELPKCVVTAIRAKYPNPEGVRYTGYQIPLT